MAFDPKEIGKRLVAVGDKQTTTGKNLEKLALSSRKQARFFQS